MSAGMVVLSVHVGGSCIGILVWGCSVGPLVMMVAMMLVMAVVVVVAVWLRCSSLGFYTSVSQFGNVTFPKFSVRCDMDPY